MRKENWSLMTFSVDIVGHGIIGTTFLPVLAIVQ
jgi:hypothetical protein